MMTRATRPTPTRRSRSPRPRPAPTTSCSSSASGGGDYTIVAHDGTTFPTLAAGTAQAGTLQSTYDIKYYQVSVSAGEHLIVVLDAAVYNSNSYDLYIKFGALPTTLIYDDAGDSPNADQAVEIPVTQAGTYYVLIRSTSGGGDYTIAAHTAATFPTLTDRHAAARRAADHLRLSSTTRCP